MIARPEIMTPGRAWRPATGALADGQIAQRKTWTRVPDQQVATAAMHIIHVVPSNRETVAVMNPLDPATVADVAPDGQGYLGPGWLQRPHGAGTLRRAGRP